MRRLFWVALGAAAGVLVVRQAGKMAKAYTPAGVAESIGGGLSDLGQALREMTESVREAMAERETELRYALGIDTGTGAQADSGGIPTQRSPTPMTTDEARALLDDPTGRRAR